MDDLHQLIRSLEPVEKRYIKRMAGKSSTRYVALFDAINAQTAYDETALREAFQTEGWFKNFAEAKRYLKELILRGLRQYNEGRNPHLELFNLLKEVEILFYKGHYHLMQNRLRHARKLAEEAERPLLMVQVLRWEHRLTTLLPAANPQEATPAGRLQAVLDKLWPRPDLLDLEASVNEAFREQGNPSSDGAPLAELRAAIDAQKNQLDDTSLYFDDHHRLDFAELTYQLMAGKPGEAYAISTKAIRQVAELPPAAQADKLLSIVQSYRTQLSLASALLRFEDVLTYVQEFQAFLKQAHLKRAKAPLAQELEFTLLNHALSAHLYLGHADDVKAYLAPAQALLKQLNETSEHHHVLQLRLAQAHLSLGEYAEAKSYVAALENRQELRPELQNRGQMLRLMSAYSLGNTDLGEHLFRQTLNKFRRTEMDSPFERRLLVFFRRLFQSRSSADGQANLNELAGFLRSLLSIPTQTRTRSEILFLLAWAEAQLDGVRVIDRIAEAGTKRA